MRISCRQHHLCLPRIAAALPLWLCILVSCLWLAFPLAPVEAGSGHPLLKLETGSNRLSLHAAQVPLQRLLRELAAAGVTVQADPAINPLISLQLENAPLTEGIEALLRPVNAAVSWEKSPQGWFYPHTIRIFAPGQEQRMEAVQPGRTFRTSRNPQTGALQIAGELLLRRSPTSSPQRFVQLIREQGGTILDYHQATGIYRITFASETDSQTSLQLLRQHPLVAAAEPHFAFPLAAPPASRLISLPSPAATAETGSARVAVLDSGLSAEAASRPWLVASYDAVSPENPSPDRLGHGTQMALIASGTVPPLGSPPGQRRSTPIIAIRVFDDNGITSSYSLLRALDFALENQARVISMSWGTETPSPLLEHSLEWAAARQLILVAAAGNRPTGKPVFPAAFAQVIGTGALQPDQTPWASSNYGPFVETMAPGFAAFALDRQSGPALFAGTSIAAAHTAGVIANYLASHPGATLEQVRAMLRQRP
ncbi:S8 family peptidase [Desulfogranum mediterraneum]|uniref:S8 family peptidase n=1 Tax=Desulfogranum mediterraneum TaxID=160661 RepID=UPI0004078D2B|nr:S8 family serine peptidase [Desulfogranum mediterraneum]